jgi:hypothetical protein
MQIGESLKFTFGMLLEMQALPCDLLAIHTLKATIETITCSYPCLEFADSKDISTLDWGIACGLWYICVDNN